MKRNASIIQTMPTSYLKSTLKSRLLERHKLLKFNSLNTNLLLGPYAASCWRNARFSNAKCSLLRNQEITNAASIFTQNPMPESLPFIFVSATLSTCANIQEPQSFVGAGHCLLLLPGPERRHRVDLRPVGPGFPCLDQLLDAIGVRIGYVVRLGAVTQ